MLVPRLQKPRHPCEVPKHPLACFNQHVTDDGIRVVNDYLSHTFKGLLAKSKQFHLGRLAAAFGITDEYLRQLRRKEETGGLTAVIGPRRGGVTKVTPELRIAWYAMFDAGRMPIDAYREQPRK